MRGRRIETTIGGIPDTVCCAKQFAYGRQHPGALGRGTHDLAVADEQGILEMRAKTRQCLAERWLGRVQPGGCACQAALRQHHFQYTQIAQFEIGLIRLWHSHHSSFGIAAVSNVG
jgi:hypothetical protein